MTVATVTSKGQITLPKVIRERLHLSAGDRVDFEIDATGGVRLRRVDQSVSSIVGMLRDPKRRPVSLKDMDAAIADGAAKRS